MSDSPYHDIKADSDPPPYSAVADTPGSSLVSNRQAQQSLSTTQAQIKPVASPSDSDMLYTPIRLPTHLAEKHVAHKARVQAKDPSPAGAEESTTRAFVQAACRVHEAMEVATAVCNQVIGRWTGGLEPEEALSESIYMAGSFSDEYAHQWTPYEAKRANNEPALTRPALVLQLALRATQLFVALVSSHTRTVFKERQLAVEAGLLLPLVETDGHTSATFSDWTSSTLPLADATTMEELLLKMESCLSAAALQNCAKAKQISTPLQSLMNRLSDKRRIFIIEPMESGLAMSSVWQRQPQKKRVGPS